MERQSWGLFLLKVRSTLLSTLPPLFSNMGSEAVTSVSETSKNHHNFWFIFNNSSNTGGFISWCKELSRIRPHVNQHDYFWAPERNRVWEESSKALEAARGTRWWPFWCSFSIWLHATSFRWIDCCSSVKCDVKWKSCHLWLLNYQLPFFLFTKCLFLFQPNSLLNP